MAHFTAVLVSGTGTGTGTGTGAGAGTGASASASAGAGAGAGASTGAGTGYWLLVGIHEQVGLSRLVSQATDGTRLGRVAEDSLPNATPGYVLHDALNAVLNLSCARVAQPVLARHGLWLLVQATALDCKPWPR